MSDHNDNGNQTNNLCTTEALGDCQEEDDFILLTDILPPEKVPVPPDGLDDMLSNEEVTSSNCLAQDFVADDNRMIQTPPIDSTISDHFPDLTTKTNLNYVDKTENIYMDIEPVSVQPTKKPYHGKKRGRKPKKANITKQACHATSGTPDYNISNFPIGPTLIESISQEPKPKSKRGRKPKTHQQNQIPIGNDTSNTVGAAENNQPRKRGGRKILKLESVNNFDGDANSTLVSEVNTVKISKKRGRKRKIQTLEDKTTTNCKFTSSNISMDKLANDDDDEADISLSKLKASLHNNGIEDTTKTNILLTNPNDTKPSMVNREVQDKMISAISKDEIPIEFECNVHNAVAETSNIMVESVNNKEESHLKTDVIFNDVTEQHEQENTSSLLEDDSKRPQRRKAKRNMRYEIDSDEDPFANVELSDDDEPRKRKKGLRYYSDDEYIPGKAGKKISSGGESEFEDIDVEENALKHKKKRGRKKSEISSHSKSPGKRGRKTKEQGETSYPEVTTITPDTTTENIDNDVEVCLQSSVIKSSDQSILVPDSPESQSKTANSQCSTEFENFLAARMKSTELQIKKVSTKKTLHTSVAPLQIPSIDSKDIKKYVEASSQTTIVQNKSAAIQTTLPYAIKMKQNIHLSPEESTNACEFLKNILRTTSELGGLMTEKAEEFINKKINTSHVQDTMKIDYCIKKAFLLFKLAKDNLTTMEENLEKQYEEFLKTNNLSSAIEVEKKIISKTPENNSDSDCEIVGETIQAKKPEKPKFNPKTVFLNKELSIKIAKKPTANVADKTKRELNIKGQHSVWINDSVMVKKVKPTQSFLAQDSRNKKPPDNCVTANLVSLFFKDYKRKQALKILEPFISPQWVYPGQIEVACNYFLINKEDQSSTSCSVEEPFFSSSTNLESNSDTFNEKYDVNSINSADINFPKTLFALCTEVLQEFFQSKSKPTMPLGVIDSLFTLCFKRMCNIVEIETFGNKNNSTPVSLEYNEVQNPQSLKSLCYYKVVDILYYTKSNKIVKQNHIKIDANNCNRNIEYDSIFPEIITLPLNVLKQSFIERYAPDSLKKVSYRKIIELIFINQDTYMETEWYNAFQIIEKVNNPKSLFHICFKVISKNIGYKTKFDQINTLTIDNINTLSEEAFFNIDENSNNSLENSQYSDDYEPYRDNEDQSNGDFANVRNENEIEEENWVSQLEMQEFKTCFSQPQSNKDLVNEDPNSVEIPLIVQIKQEYVEEHTDSNNEDVRIKKEPQDQTEIVNIPNNIQTTMVNVIAKGEFPDYEENSVPTHEVVDYQESNPRYDVETFEAFVRSNKMIRSLEKDFYLDDSIFSQSALRIRKHFEPDSDNENESDMSLLVPHLPEPLTTDKAKGSLLQKSSGDETDKPMLDKKIDKKKKITQKKKTTNIEVVKSTKKIVKTTPTAAPSTPPLNEIAILTRRMKEKIRHEENKNESSDDDSESLSNVKHKKKKDIMIKDKDKNVSSAVTPVKVLQDKEASFFEKARSLRSNKAVQDAIQCNDVDSTAPMDENDQIISKISEPSEVISAITTNNQNVVSKRQGNKVYNKPGPKSKKKNIILQSNDVDFKENIETSLCRPHSPLIMVNEPAELLECEPSMPEFYADVKASTKDDDQTMKTEVIYQTDTAVNYKERHGWRCCPIDRNDIKLCQIPHISLEKLPEEFVQTYFKYQEIAKKSEDEAEIDRLTNLKSLHRTSSIKDTSTGNKESKSKLKLSDKQSLDVQGSADVNNSEQAFNSPATSDHYEELSPSEDDGLKIDDEMPPSVLQQSTENYMAKSSLMNDEESDTEKVSASVEEIITEIKKEPDESVPKVPKLCIKLKDDKKLTVGENPGALVLTADKMMKMELNLLHAPVNMEDEVKESKYTPTNIKLKRKQRSTRNQIKHEKSKSDDSSSEEEKQWVSRKQKLLRRMENKNVQENTSVEDAKRAKLVSEFIEKRCEPGPNSKRKRGRGPRSRKKFLEKQKQMRVLSKELFGEAAVTAGKKSFQGYAKGRRNIRKVLDKKSLARSTVIANMEEFERKQRLNVKQSRLRELLGVTEEGVNVLVINDEVCLEYDFEELQPVVTIHPFFTKVMKAHQYEGVKFMWDACFESLEMVESGQAGGGCILAHCMGLGKTLQVLALLHTVLTHPRVGMQRVLVCCPLSTVLNWVDEIHKWLGPVTDQIKVFELSKLKKAYERAYQLEDWYNGGGIFIIGYELFRSLTTLDPEFDDVRPTIINKIRSALLDPGPDIIVCDEGHLLKNDTSVLAVAMSRVRTKRRIVLTGTPMQNNLREYYCMVNFVKPNLLGTYAEYSNRFENPIMNGQHRDSREEDIRLMKTRTHILHKVLEGCLQRQEASVLYPYLPKKYEYTVFITLTKCQSDLYREYLEGYANKSSKNSILKDYNILQKIWSHPRVLDNFQNRKRDEAKWKRDEASIKAETLEDDLAREDLNATEDVKPTVTEEWWLQHLNGGSMLDSLESSNKFLTVFRILKECVELDDKLLIFSTSLYTMDSLEYFLGKINNWRLGQEYYRLDGSVPPEVRQKWCREFNSENNHKTKLFLISTRAGSLGLNMTAANRVIILDTSWNPAHDIQSIFRIYRFGQKKDCYIYRLVAMGTMEQKIYERSVTKQAVSCRVVDEQNIDRHYNMAELTELYRFDELGEGVAGGVAAGVRDVVLLRVARDLTALHAAHEHDSLLRGGLDAALPEHERDAAWLQFEQEQRRNQLQSELTTYRKAVPSKRPHGHNYSLSSHNNFTPSGSTDNPTTPVKDEYHLDPKDPEYLPLSKPRKGRKTSTVTSDIPGQKPSTSQTHQNVNISNLPVTIVPDSSIADPNANDIIKKITEALKQHNLTNTEGPLSATEVAKLVSSIISSSTVNATSAPLTNDPPKETEIDTNSNAIISDPVPSTNVNVTEKRRGRPRKHQIETKLSATNTATTISERETRSRRRKHTADEEPLPTEMLESQVNKRPLRPKKCVSQNEARTVEQTPVPVTQAENVEVFDESAKRRSKRKSAIVAGRLLNNIKDLDTLINDSETESADNTNYTHDINRDLTKTLPPLQTPVPVTQAENVEVFDESAKRRSKRKSAIVAGRLLNNIKDLDTLINDSETESADNTNYTHDINPDLTKTLHPLQTPVPVTQAENVKVFDESANRRSKRKSAIVAGRHLNNIKGLDNLNNDFETEPADSTNYTPDINPDVTKTLHPLEKSPKLTYVEPTTIPTPPDTNIKIEKKSQPNDEISIILSDDEGCSTTEEPKNDVNYTVPLHTSLLTNKNFIKIVAHTYLKGNHMLDEDAATLAAEYSTSKALKEVESTGKSINNGPIYDIAVQVLGVNVLKKLHEADAKKKNQNTPVKSGPSKPIETKTDTPIITKKASRPGPKTAKLRLKDPSELMKADHAKPENTKSITSEPQPMQIETEKLAPVQPRRRRNNNIESAPSISNDAPTPEPMTGTAPGVVPVGLFKRTDDIVDKEQFAPPPSDDECILPDDDDVHIVSASPPPVRDNPTTHAITEPPNLLNMLTHKKAQKIVITRVNTKSNNLKAEIPKIVLPSGTQTLNIKDLEASGLKLVALKKVNQLPQHLNTILQRTDPPSTPTKPAATALSASTICLDSDDEELPTIVGGPMPGPGPAYLPINTQPNNSKSPQVVPVTLTAAFPNQYNIPTASQPQEITQPGPQQVIVGTTIGTRQVIHIPQAPNMSQKKMFQISLPQGQNPTFIDLSQVQPMADEQSRFYIVPTTALKAEASQKQLPPVSADETITPKSKLTSSNTSRVEAASSMKGFVPIAPAPSKLTTPTQCKIPNIVVVSNNSAPANTSPPSKTMTESNCEKLKPPIMCADASSSVSTNKTSLMNKSLSKEMRDRRVSISTSSSSDRSRSASPVDPLSILKNVIHIQAPAPLPNNTQSKPDVISSDMPEKSKSSALHNITTTYSNTQGKPKTNILYKPVTTSSKILEKSRSNVLQTKVGVTSTKSSNNIQSTSSGESCNVSKISKDQTKKVIPSDQLRLLATFDLTDLDDTDNKNKKPKPNIETKNKMSKVAGSSKSILIGGPSKSLLKAQSEINPSEGMSKGMKPRNSRIIHITNVQTIALPVNKNKGAPDVKRKASTTPTVESKKKKINQPTRLEDFTLDDIGDIIELE